MNVHKLPTAQRPVFTTTFLPQELPESFIDIDFKIDDFNIYLEHQ